MDLLPRDKVVIGGLYHHFKGSLYRVIDLVHNSENWDQALVVYYDVHEPIEHRVARPVEMFCEEVEKVEEYNYKGPRFAHAPGMDDPPDWKVTALKLYGAHVGCGMEDQAFREAGLTDTEIQALQTAALRYAPIHNYFRIKEA